MSFESIYERDSNRLGGGKGNVLCDLSHCVFSLDLNEDFSEFISPPLPLAPCSRIENKTF